MDTGRLNTTEADGTAAATGHQNRKWDEYIEWLMDDLEKDVGAGIEYNRELERRLRAARTLPSARTIYLSLERRLRAARTLPSARTIYLSVEEEQKEYLPSFVQIFSEFGMEVFVERPSYFDIFDEWSRMEPPSFDMVVDEWNRMSKRPKREKREKRDLTEAIYEVAAMRNNKWTRFVTGCLGMPEISLQKIRGKVGKTSKKQKIQALKYWMQKEGHTGAGATLLIQMTEEFLGRNVFKDGMRNQKFAKVSKAVVDAIPNDRWMRFARIQLVLSRSEMKILKSNYAEFSEDQKYQILKHWIEFGKMPEDDDPHDKEDRRTCINDGLITAY